MTPTTYNFNTHTLQDWLVLEKEGNYEACQKAFFDFFCAEKVLKQKTKNLAPKVKKFINALYPYLNLQTTYLLFKNNCPVTGTLYDDFRVVCRKTGQVLFTVTPSLGFNGDQHGKVSLYIGGSKKSSILFDTWAQCILYTAHNAKTLMEEATTKDDPS